MDITPIFSMNSERAAEFIGLAESTLAKMRMTVGAGPPYFKIGRRVVYDLADIKEWMLSKKKL